MKHTFRKKDRGTQERESPPQRVFVDSSAWIAASSRRDQYHEEAASHLRAALSGPITLLTTNLVLAEVHRLTLFRMGILAAVSALDKIEFSAHVSIEFVTKAQHLAAREWLNRFPNLPLTYTDAVSFAVMESLGCRTALSFDRHFVIAGFSLWK